MATTHLEREATIRPRSVGSSQGDVLATWSLWALLLVAMAATYARLDIADLYNVSRDGVVGAGSRLLVQLNYPIALVAIAAILIALDTLGGRWWWLGGAAMAACAVTTWPGVVDADDLDARMINAIPAIGVIVAVVLTVAAARRSGHAMVGRQPYDTARKVIAVTVVVLSLPWLAADVGVYWPDVGFIAERPITGSDGVVSPAVHLGHHHGLDGSLILLSALLLSRPRLRSRVLSAVTTGYVALMAAYGAVNATQDFWNEQIQKRGWTEWSIPNATEPALSIAWLIIVAGTAAVFLLLRRESERLPEFGRPTANR